MTALCFFIFLLMRIRALSPVLFVALALVGCQAAVDVDADSSTSSSSADSSVMMEQEAFTGMHTNVDASGSTIVFMGGSNIVNHDGGFRSFTATVTPDVTDPSDFTKATVTANINVASVYSDSNGLTGHLQKEDFFDVANHPEATFTSTEIVKTGDSTYDITGDLTVKGVTQSATFSATVSDASVVATYDLPRRDFGIGNDHYGDKLLNETVPVTVTLVFVQQ